MKKSVTADYPRLFQIPGPSREVPVDEAVIRELFARLSKSSFRRKFRLDCADAEYVRAQGEDIIWRHAEAIVRQRLAPADLPNDGRQTPYHGHPVFRAQHATACCCRGCLEKWHGIKKGTQLTEGQISYICNVLTAWIKAEAKKFE